VGPLQFGNVLRSSSGGRAVGDEADGSRPRRHGHVAAICLVALVVVSACGGSAATHASGSDSSPVVPGGAKLEVKPGTPAFCAQLVASAPIRALSMTLIGLSEEPPAADAISEARLAATALRSIGAGVSSALKTQFVAAGNSLDQLAGAPASQAASDSANTAITELGEGVQGQCDFPLT
jgi:hypothetical protein